MPYVTDMSDYELNVHVERLQKMQGWHEPLVDRMKSRIDDLEAEVKEYKLQYGLLKIELENRARLLNSCETALRERDGL